MRITPVRIKVGEVIFVADLPADESPTGKLFAKGSAVLRMEQEVARWIVEHGAHGPDSLRILRAAAGLTGSQVAELLGVDRAMVSRWENGKADPGIALWNTVAALALDAIEGSTRTADRLRATQTEQPEAGEISLQVWAGK